MAAPKIDHLFTENPAQAGQFSPSQRKSKNIDKTRVLWQRIEMILHNHSMKWVFFTCAFIYVVTNSVKTSNCSKFHSQHKLGDVRWKQEEKHSFAELCKSNDTRISAPPKVFKKKAVRYQIKGVHLYWCKCVSIHTYEKLYKSEL